MSLSKRTPLCLRNEGIDLPKYAYSRKTVTTISIGSPTTRLAASRTSSTARVAMTTSIFVFIPARRTRPSYCVA